MVKVDAPTMDAREAFRFLQDEINWRARERRELLLRSHQGRAAANDAARIDLLQLQIDALRSAQHVLGSGAERVRPVHARRGRIEPSSNTGLTIAILGRVGRPLHVTEIIRQLDLFYSRKVDRQTLTSILVKHSKAGNRIRAHGNSTFSLTTAVPPEETDVDTGEQRTTAELAG